MVPMDKSTLPYEVTKSICYDGRLMAPKHPICEAELVGLELDAKAIRVSEYRTIAP